MSTIEWPWISTLCKPHDRIHVILMYIYIYKQSQPIPSLSFIKLKKEAYLMLGNPTGNVLIIAQWRASTLTQYLTWFDKSPTSTGESILFRDKERITTQYMEEEDHFTQTQLPALSAALCSCAIATLSFSLLSCTHSRFLPLLTHLALNTCLFYRQMVTPFFQQ